MSNEAESFLPLHPLDFRILLVLHEGATHAYAIVSAIEADPSAGRVYPANLYRRLRDMTAAGLLEERTLPPKPGDRRRRNFRLSPLGRRVLEAEATRMARLVADARHAGVLP